MSEVRENEIALRKVSGGTAHLRGNTACAVSFTVKHSSACTLTKLTDSFGAANRKDFYRYSI